MAVWLSPELQTSEYWQEVQSLANGLLEKSPSPLPDWTVRIRPKAGQDLADSVDAVPAQDEIAQELWHVEANFGDKELTIGVPGEWESEEGDDEPEDSATHVILDLLLGIVTRHEVDEPGSEPVEGKALPNPEDALDELVERWRECRRMLEEVRNPEGGSRPANGTPSESALLEEIERLDAEIWWSGHDRGAG